MTFTKATLKPLHADIVEALTAVAAKHGLQYRSKGGTYSDATYTARAEFTATDADAQNWMTWHALYGFAVEDLHKPFKAGTKHYIIKSLRDTRGNKPVVATQRENGKEYAFPVAGVRRALGYPPPQLTKIDINGNPAGDEGYKSRPFNPNVDINGNPRT